MPAPASAASLSRRLRRAARRAALPAAALAGLLLAGFGFLFVANPCLRGDVDPGGGRGWVEVTLTPGGRPFVGMDGHVTIALEERQPIPDERLVATVLLRVGQVHWLRRTAEKLFGLRDAPAVVPDADLPLLDTFAFEADFPRARDPTVKERITVRNFRACRRDARIRTASRDGRTYTLFLEAYRR